MPYAALLFYLYFDICLFMIDQFQPHGRQRYQVQKQGCREVVCSFSLLVTCVPTCTCNPFPSLSFSLILFHVQVVGDKTL